MDLVERKKYVPAEDITISPAASSSPIPRISTVGPRS
jgi:hypothetical protein